MKKAGCAVCHTVEKKFVCPSYKDVARKRKGEPGAVALLEKEIREGSKDIYGEIPMPPNPRETISDADVHAMVEWLLTK